MYIVRNLLEHTVY